MQPQPQNKIEGAIMKSFCKWILAGALMSLVLNLSTPLFAATVVDEGKLITDLSSPNEQVVIKALMRLEKEYPTSTNAFPAMKKLLTDPRSKVQRKAARVLGSLHAAVDDADLKNICSLLKSADPKTVVDGLMALRGLKAAQAVPEILPCLKSSNSHVIRDACRTLAVLANKDVIPSIEPLLTHPDKAVQKDAQDAIYALRAKA